MAQAVMLHHVLQMLHELGKRLLHPRVIKLTLHELLQGLAKSFAAWMEAIGVPGRTDV